MKNYKKPKSKSASKMYVSRLTHINCVLISIILDLISINKTKKKNEMKKNYSIVQANPPLTPVCLICYSVASCYDKKMNFNFNSYLIRMDWLWWSHCDRHNSLKNISIRHCGFFFSHKFFQCEIHSVRWHWIINIYKHSNAHFRAICRTELNK